MIKTTTLENLDNADYGTLGGNDTKDKVFLLSLLETINYEVVSNDPTDWKNYIKGQCVATAYAIAHGAYYVITDDGEKVCNWWLRSPGGYKQLQAAEVDTLGHNDSLGSRVDLNNVGVRPDLYINLNP